MKRAFTSKKELGRKILGPIFLEFCARLHNRLSLVPTKDRAILLYMTRAGVKIRRLYEVFRNMNKLEPLLLEGDFYVSRLACAKACLATDFEFVLPILVKPYRNDDFSTFSSGAFPSVHVDTDSNYPHEISAQFRQTYSSSSDSGQRLRAYFKEQARLMGRYLADLTKGRNLVYLVDTGWYASTQAMLMRSFPSYDWTGLYFGKWSYGRPTPSHFKKVEGISVDDAQSCASNARSAVFAYHHLIEAPLELDAPSVKGYVLDKKLHKVVPDPSQVMGRATSICEQGEHFHGILDYFHASAGQDDETIVAKANDAYRRLRQLVLFPNKGDVPCMEVDPRSIDFGKAGHVPVLQSPLDGGLAGKAARIRRALWKQGQVAMEFPWPVSLLLQKVYPFRRAV